ncbi:cytochrome P450 [Russula aff. rugulosa BPL654]|nr:cytochrome P450 [Russula aff. rugulosa BPL654]
MSVVSLISALDILVLVTSIAAFFAIRDYQRRRGLPYPPGPRPLPLIGNLLDIPKQFSWLAYSQISKKHGDVVSFHVFGKVIIVLNSLKANKDLLEKRGDVYSDRPVIPIFQMMKWEWNLTFSNYTESFRQARKLLDRSLRPAMIATYRPLLQTKAHVLLTHVLANPDELDAHFHHLPGSLILAMVYGYEVKGINDRNVIAAKNMMQLSSKMAFPGAILVNDLPFLRHIPEWLPWLSYKPLARYGYNIGQEVLHGPMQFVRESILNGTAQPSLALDNLQETEKLEEPERGKAEELITSALGSLYKGRWYITSVLMVFVVAVLLRPEVQTMAQKELDAVTRRERLPELEDRLKLPFVDAICKEVIRWKPVAPLGVPHATTEDDVYNGFFVPKGWYSRAVLHDPVMYPDPDSFKPERFINEDGSLRDDPILASLFGFGKRICPGRHLADAMIFIVIASLLSVFNIEKGNDTNGTTDDYPFTGGGINRPCPFACSIIPRDRKAEELILADSPIP